LAWLVHYRTVQAEPPDEKTPVHWPVIDTTASPHAPMLYPVAFLAGCGPLIERLRAMGVDESIIRDTLCDMDLWMEDYHRRFGRYGLDEPGWIDRSFKGLIFQLGRLQFEMVIFQQPFEVYRRDDGRTIALLADGQTLRRDGQFDGANGKTDPNAWTSSLQTAGETIIAYPVAPTGRAICEPTQLDTAEWQRRITSGDPILFVHIPAASRHGRMTPDACADSFARSSRFFPRYFPAQSWRGFYTQTWLLDPQLADHLPESSNIVQFQRWFYRLPMPGATDKQTLDRVFGGPIDPGTFQPKSSLQRAVLAIMAAGRRCRETAGFRLWEHATASPGNYQTDAPHGPPPPPR
jgi:hypothetical protein